MEFSRQEYWNGLLSPSPGESSRPRDQTWVSCIAGRCFTVWDTRESQILCTDAYIWNLERWYWWIYFEGSNGETDIENRPKDMVGGEEREGEMYGKSNMEIYNTICKIDSQWVFAVRLTELKQWLCDNLEGWDGDGDERRVWEGQDMCVPMANSSWCMTENHKILQSKYSSLKEK